jgi:hypothetical protein
MKFGRAAAIRWIDLGVNGGTLQVADRCWISVELRGPLTSGGCRHGLNFRWARAGRRAHHLAIFQLDDAAAT